MLNKLLNKYGFAFLILYGAIIVFYIILLKIKGL